MKHRGDITKISGYEVPSVDAIIGGSPCQDLSVAGKRAGLQGKRSGLFMEQIRIIREMREASKENGTTEIRPRYMVWENVPGAFSTNGGEDFRAVLEETVRIVDKDAVIPRPAGGKWRNSGCIVGDGFTVSWRVLDAQFWGVPQRRRRIALVADFGGGSAPEILFERKSVQRSIEESGDERKGIAAAVKRDVGEAIGFNYLMGTKAESVGAAIEQSGTLKAGCDDASVCYSINLLQDPVPNREKTTSLGTGNNKSGQGSLGVVVYAIDRAAFNQGRNAKYAPNISTDGIVQTLVSRGPCGVCYDMMHESEVIRESGVRRLTPLECERLQGYPDGWTDIGEWVDNKGKKHESSDAARYKALGNSIALPPWRWVLKRIGRNYNRRATMASLFDGIGGFPLIWEEINGKGSCLWASEIEEFAVAVTKKRIGE